VFRPPKSDAHWDHEPPSDSFVYNQQLTDPYSTDKTFDDYFYQDREDLRRNGKE